MNAITAARSAVRVKLNERYFILLSLRQPFGGTPCPSEFAVVADIITDTINDLLEDEEWDHDLLYSKLVDKIPVEKGLSDNIPFHQVQEMSASIIIGENGKSDVYVDDIITIVVDINVNLQRIKKAPITVMHAVVDNATMESKNIKRKDIVSYDKRVAEGAAEEEKIYLGWLLNTMNLLVKLPNHKSTAWRSQISSLLDKKTVSNKELQSILGRMENVAQIMTPLGYFLSNIRHMQIIAERKGHNIRLNKDSRDDL